MKKIITTLMLSLVFLAMVCSVDLNKNYKIDYDDYRTFLGDWRSNSYVERSDFNQDGQIDSRDYMIMRQALRTRTNTHLRNICSYDDVPMATMTGTLYTF